MKAKSKKEMGRKLKELRQGKKLKQTEVAKSAGINTNYYAKVERGEVSPSLETLRKILKVLKAGTWDILSF